MLTVKPLISLDDPSYEFPKKIEDARELVLLEKGTCTYRAGQRFIRAAFEEAPKIIEANSFDEAIELTRYPKGVLLLPFLANEPLVKVTCSYEWRDLSDFTFEFANPPLHLAGRQNAQPEDLNEETTCAALPNLHGLLGDEIVTWVDVDNTQQAAIQCGSEAVDLCITNGEGLVANGLASIRELKRMSPVWFSYERVA